jgi:hypothetical protein
LQPPSSCPQLLRSDLTLLSSPLAGPTLHHARTAPPRTATRDTSPGLSCVEDDGLGNDDPREQLRVLCSVAVRRPGAR